MFKQNIATETPWYLIDKPLNWKPDIGLALKKISKNAQELMPKRFFIRPLIFAVLLLIP